MEACLMHNTVAILAIPSQFVDAILWSRLFKDDADSVCKSDRVVGHIGREKKQLALVYWDVQVRRINGIVDDAENHRTLVLVEELGSSVDVKVGSSVGTANNLQRSARYRKEEMMSQTITVMSLLYTQ